MPATIPVHDTIDFGVGQFPGESLHTTLAGLQTEAPVIKARFMGMEAYVITRYAEILEAFRDNERFPPERIYKLMFEPIAGPTFQTLTGRDHLIRRQLATRAFRAKAVRSYDETLMLDLANELLDRIGNAPEVDLAARFTRLFPFILISRLLGVPRDAEDRFHGWALALLRFAEDPPRARAANAELTDYLQPIVDQRREQPGDDIISDLLQAEVEGESFTNAEVLSHVRLIFSAGASTTHDAIGNLVYQLLREPGLWAQVGGDATLRTAAVAEILRCDPPVSILPRTGASTAINFAGATIPANAMVLFAISAANRDPRVFDDPAAFRLDREDLPILTTFGPGPRACPGLHLARRQLELLLEQLSIRFPGMTLRDEPAARPVGAVLRGPAQLPVRLQA